MDSPHQQSSTSKHAEPSEISPPTQTRAQTLPFTTLTWENFERLCLRLARLSGNVEDVRRYGTRGQKQQGIDLYVHRYGGEYETWQCKRCKTMTKTVLRDSVKKFLEGDWAKRTKKFRFAVASSLNPTELAEEIEVQRVFCESSNIIFSPMDSDKLSIMLKDHPQLVDDFFGRHWVEAFNGPEAVASLSGRKLNPAKKEKARKNLQTLYDSHFRTVDGGIPAVTPIFQGAIGPVPVYERYVEPFIELVESVIERKQSQTPNDGGGVSSDLTSSSTNELNVNLEFQRREIRTKVKLSTGLASGHRILLLGGAGFGKSAALRVVIHSLLSRDGKFPDIAKEWGSRLPLLFSFGFLTRHFADNESATIESALKAWLVVLGANNDVLKLLEEMLTDKRLLLLVDGIDEWQNREAAISALDSLTTYAETRKLPLIATGRLLGFENIGDFGPEWKRVNLLKLTSDQQNEIVDFWFRYFRSTEEASDEDTLNQAVLRDVTEFSNELCEDTAISELGGIPLLLSGMIYLKLSGRILPKSRLAVIQELLKALLEDQPRRRSQAALQRSDQANSRSIIIRRGIEFIAFQIHQEPISLSLQNERASQFLQAFFQKEMQLSVADAVQQASHVIELGKREFGLFVQPQEGHVGLVHRIFQETLAANHLSRQPLDQLIDYCNNFGSKSQWHEVTLALLQLLSCQNKVDLLIDELRKPVANSLDEPLQKIILARLSARETNCSQTKANELIADVFSWIECGRWMPLRLSLVQEISVGLHSEQVGSLVAARAIRWFPGRVRWVQGIPEAVSKDPTETTVSDLWILLHNCNHSHEYREAAEALARLSNSADELKDELLRILTESAEQNLMAAALHALALGWPSHPDLPAILEAACISGAGKLRRVAILARFRLGERDAGIREALIDFCRKYERQWPWEGDIIDALCLGWPNDFELKEEALKRLSGMYGPNPLNEAFAIKYLLRCFPGDDEVAKLLSDQLIEESRSWFHISDLNEDLLSGFRNHPLLVSAAKNWVSASFKKTRSPLDFSVIAQFTGQDSCRQALLNWLRRGNILPHCIISTLLEICEPDDAEVQEALIEYITDENRRSDSVRWLPKIIQDGDELRDVLWDIFRRGEIMNSLNALEILMEMEGADELELWAIVSEKLQNDTEGHYWRYGYRTLIRLWPENPLIRKLVKDTLFTGEIQFSYIFEVYGRDPQIRPLLDSCIRVLKDDLRMAFIQAIEPKAQRGVESAMEIISNFKYEPVGEARTVAARGYARGCIRNGIETNVIAEELARNLTSFNFDQDGIRQAAIVVLLELGRTDLIAEIQESNQQSGFSTMSDYRYNWEFVASVVEHWENLDKALPCIWEVFRHSPVIASELVKVEKAAHATTPIRMFEDRIRSNQQLAIDEIRALISYHGQAEFLKDLFVERIKQFHARRHRSIMFLEHRTYGEMLSYLAEHFGGDETLGNELLEFLSSQKIHDQVMNSLCRGWPGMSIVTKEAEKLSDYIESPKPYHAWLFSTKANARLMTNYVMRFPDNCMHMSNDYVYEVVIAIRKRLQSDHECLYAVFEKLKTVRAIEPIVAITKLIAPLIGKETEFQEWVSEQLHEYFQQEKVLGNLVFDLFSNDFRPVEFTLLEAVLTPQ